MVVVRVHLVAFPAQALTDSSVIDKVYRVLLTSLLGITTFIFWMCLYPQVLSYQEQNQLFLFTWGYLAERLALPGGPADWISEFLVQFFYYRWAGALILALLAILLQLAVWKAAKSAGIPGQRGAYVLTLIPSLLLMVYMGDVEVLVSFPVALLISLWFCPLFIRAGWHRLWLIPLGWWLAGPVIVVPVLVSVIQRHKLADLLMLVYTLLAAFAFYRLLAPQYPPRDAFFGLNYYRIVETLPVLQIVIPAVALFCIFLCSVQWQFRRSALVGLVATLLMAAGTFWGITLTYDKETHETLAYDWLIRHERYAEVIKRAEKYQPHNPVSACSVNFCLFTQGQLASRMNEFFQCGTEGLVLPSIRDNLSDITSAQLLWMMGMPNITLQYCFDLQESIQNGRKSGRFTSRIAECNIVNGWYDRAERYLDMLEHSLFYRKWAKTQKALIQDEDKVAADPVYAYIRSVRFQDDFITQYEALDLMMAILYNQNQRNFMAAQYYEAWQRFKTKEVAQ